MESGKDGTLGGRIEPLKLTRCREVVCLNALVDESERNDNENEEWDGGRHNHYDSGNLEGRSPEAAKDATSLSLVSLKVLEQVIWLLTDLAAHPPH